MEKIIKSKITQKILIAVLAIFFICLYLYRLDLVPVHLNQDEMMFGLNAYSIAKFGHDFYGNLYPFYFWHLGSFWATPIIVYVTSLFLKFLPFSESTIRVSGVFVGLSSIFLMAVLAKKVFKNSLYFSLALIITGTIPVLFINSRVLLDNIWPIPFVLLWLIFLKSYSDKESFLTIFLSGLALGIGLHSYHAAKVIMPIYFVASLIYLFLSKKAKVLSLILFAIGFAIPIILFIPWLKLHPDTLLNQVSYIGSLDKSVSVSKGIWGVVNLDRLKDISSNYFTYFSSKILFTEGDRSLIHSTGRIGAFSFGIAFLLVFGIAEVLSNKNDWFSKLILFGFVTYPVASSLVNDPQRISRSLIVVVFVGMLSLYGAKFLIERKEKIFRYLLLGILVFVILEFSGFISDYFGDYRIRSSSWFNGSIGSMYESVIKSTDLRKVDKIYVDANIYFAENYFDFYQIKFGKDLKNKTVYFDPRFENFPNLPSRSLVAIQVSDIPTKPERIGLFQKIETVRELNGNETFLDYYRD